ncbi:uncharacterized protein LOC131146190 isoform X1 [Malania oleifera]|uniref:uncharacterized protein LOC131146190 isoform X1 n=1 Tax=Malania oleifera TaxID=397392 RepID=UPI0025AE11A1|nr:uncharacterized protein LOC131146190 isoform X1 [Malania oleifera]
MILFLVFTSQQFSSSSASHQPTSLSSSPALCIGISSHDIVVFLISSVHWHLFLSIISICASHQRRSSQMEDAIGTTDEALAPSLTPTAPEGSGLHDFVISGTVLQRAVLPEDSYELKMILTKSLTSATPMPLISSCSFI